MNIDENDDPKIHNCKSKRKCGLNGLESSSAKSSLAPGALEDILVLRKIKSTVVGIGYLAIRRSDQLLILEVTAFAGVLYRRASEIQNPRLSWRV
jgi:hypothetical protein